MYISRNVSISPLLSILLILLVVICYDLLYCCGVSCNFSFFTSNFIYLALFLFFLISLAKCLSILSVFSKTGSYFHWSFLLFLYFIYFCSKLYDFFPSNFVVLLLLLLLFLAWFFLVPLVVRLVFIWVFLLSKVSLYHYNLPLRTTFAAYHKFWIFLSLFSLISRWFLNFFFDLQWSADFIITCLAYMCLCLLHFFSYSWFLISKHFGQRRCLIWFQFS